jgi:hypothetical protein
MFRFAQHDTCRRNLSGSGCSLGRHCLRVRIDLQKALDLSAPIPNPNLSREKGALLLRILDGLRFKNKDALLAGERRARPSVTVRLNIDDEPGTHVGRRVLHNY